MAFALRYFTEFDKSAFQHITDSAHIELRRVVLWRDGGWGVQCSQFPIIGFSTPFLVFISEIVWARNFTMDGS